MPICRNPGVLSREFPRRARVAPILALVLLAGCAERPRVAYKELLDPDPQIRADAATRLGQARAADAVDSLIATLDDKDEFVRVSVIRSLGQIGDRRATPPLAELADDPLGTVRVAVGQAFTDLADPASVPTLEKMIYDSDDTVRLCAVRALGKIETPEALQSLLNVALRDESELVRQHVVRVIGERNAKEAIPLVENALRSDSEIVRAHAARVLGQIGDRSSVPVLVEALEDPFHKVRSLSAHSLAALAPNDADATAAMKRQLSVETNQLTQVDLAWSLARAGDRSELGVLHTMLFKGEPEDVRAEAAMGLGEIGDANDLPRLEKALSDRKGLVRRQVVQAIEKIQKRSKGTAS